MKFYILVLFAILSMADFALAQATLSVQGTVQKSTGNAVDDGDYSLTFKLYTTETGGTAVWSETQDPVNIIGGVYSVTLGTVTPLTAAFDQTYYLGIAVGTGTELIPRARLTSSPYALSLIGQNNIFPSTGAVGVGTVAPAAGNELHVKDAAAAAQVLVEGATTSKVVVQSANGSEIEFKKGANTASITYDGTNINVQNLNLSSFSPAELAVTSKLAVGQASVDANNAFKVTGDSYMAGGLEINGGKTFTWSGFSFFNNSFTGGNIGYNGGSTTQPVSLKTNGNILTSASFAAYSDRRIKKDFRLSENLADLATLRKLHVTDYRYIDRVEKGQEFKKGFVAQEVKEAFPEAVTFYQDFVPNVYALSAQTQVLEGKMTISVDKNHEFAVGDEVKLMLPTGGEKRTTVLAAPTENTFVVDWSDEAPAEQVFIFGKKVSDFHTVDYDRIFTLNVSATQELARRVEQLEAENAALRQRNDGLQQQNEGLRSDVNNILQRLQGLEKKTLGYSNIEK